MFFIKIIKSYFNLLKLSFLKPGYVVKNFGNRNSLKIPIFFFLANILLASSIGFGLQTFLNQNLDRFFFGIFETIVLIPFYALLFSLISAIIYLLAKVFGGKGSFHQTMTALASSSSPIIFIWVPTIGLLALFFILFLTIINLQKTHELVIANAIIITLLPAFPAIMIVAKSIGISL